MNKKKEITSILKRLNNLPYLLKFWAKKKPNQKFLYNKNYNGDWVGKTFIEISSDIKKIMNYFNACGLQKGDRVLILSNNRIEWVEFDIATMTMGGITVPSFVTNNIHDNEFIINDCNPKIIILENENIYKKNLSIFKNKQDRVITIDKSKKFLYYDRIISENNENNNLYKITSDDISSIIYTSGTTGNPKGVVLTHKSIIHNLQAAEELINDFNLDEERFLSFLPLSHSYERMAGLYFPLTIGAKIYFCSSTNKLLKELKEVKPTIFSAVPRLYENIFKKIKSQIYQSNIFISFFLHNVFKYIKKDKISFIKIFLARVFIKFVLEKRIKIILGGKIKVLISGGAALNPEVGKFFNELGLNLLQGYGQTEASPLISCNRKSSNDPKTVGRVVKGVKVRISTEGEILIKGNNLMLGYWNNLSLTRKTIRKGWLCTGDLGFLDSSGRIIINGRKKDLIVTSGGDNISPQKIETMFLEHNNIENVAIYGDNKPYLVALIFVEKKNKKIEKDLKIFFSEINKKLNSIERIRKFLILKKKLSYKDGFITQTLKIKKNRVFAHYKREIQSLYSTL